MRVHRGGGLLVAVKLRLKRFGQRHRSFFRLNAVDSRKPRDGRVIEELGWYDPANKDPKKQIRLKLDRITYWLSVGAQPTETVADLLKRFRPAADSPANGGVEAAG
ncbi:MAG: 30S ribosomal protein S16 [Planctomycetes bacterium]|nr:30S ribosomal protein S16 [Planctomycetota bacterium]